MKYLKLSFLRYVLAGAVLITGGSTTLFAQAGHHNWDRDGGSYKTVQYQQDRDRDWDRDRDRDRHHDRDRNRDRDRDRDRRWRDRTATTNRPDRIFGGATSAAPNEISRSEGSGREHSPHRHRTAPAADHAH